MNKTKTGILIAFCCILFFYFEGNPFSHAKTQKLPLEPIPAERAQEILQTINVPHNAKLYESPLKLPILSNDEKSFYYGAVTLYNNSVKKIALLPPACIIQTGKLNKIIATKEPSIDYNLVSIDDFNQTINKKLVFIPVKRYIHDQEYWSHISRLNDLETIKKNNPDKFIVLIDETLKKPIYKLYVY